MRRMMASLTVGPIIAAVLVLGDPTSVASAQVLNSQRDCYTILKCNYAKGGNFRGCISTYSCKSCSFVPVSCSARGTSACRKLKCGWDG